MCPNSSANLTSKGSETLASKPLESLHEAVMSIASFKFKVEYSGVTSKTSHVSAISTLIAWVVNGLALSHHQLLSIFTDLPPLRKTSL